jgi:hypothetical protein
MTNITIELDIAWDYYNTSDYIASITQFYVTDKLIELEGPAGGNPLVEFTATEDNLRNLLTSWEYDPSDIEYFLGD